MEPAYPARTVVCFSSMLTGATPAEHGMRSNFAPRLGVRCESVFDVLEREGRRGRLVGIAHLLDPFGEDVVRSVTSVQPTSEIDRSLAAAGARVVEEEDPDLLVLQLLAADQLGHVRGVRSPEYLAQLAETDRHVGGFLAFLEERGKLDGATVILMADHGQGRGIGGHGHLDWGERPVPFVVWGEGAVPGAVVAASRARVLELAPTVARLLGVRSPSPRAAGRSCRRRTRRWSPRVRRPSTGSGALPRASSSRATRRPRSAPCSPASRATRAGCRWTCSWSTTAPATPPPAIGRASTAHACTRTSAHAGSAPPLRTGLEIARDEGYAAAVYIDGDGEYDPAELRAAARADRARSRGLRARLALPRPARGHELAPHAREPLDSALLGLLLGHGHERRPDRLPRLLAPRALAAARIAHDYNYAQVLTLSLWGAGIEAVEVPIRYRRRASGRSFVRYPEYLARVAPARLARVARRARLAQGEQHQRHADRARQPRTATRRPARTTGTAR